MTIKETAGILALLREYYPRDIASTDFQAKVKAWHLVLVDYPFEAVKAAIVAFAAKDTRGFMPAPGQIVAELHQFDRRDEMTAQEAWAIVDKAVRGLNQFEVEKAFNKLPALCQKAVGSPSVLREWASGSSEEAYITVIYSQFIKAYNIYQQRERDMAAIPADIRAMLGAVADRMALPGEEAG